MTEKSVGRESERRTRKQKEWKKMALRKMEPTPKERQLVQQLSAQGFKHEHICFMIGIRSAKTLRRYFREELKVSRLRSALFIYKAEFDMAVSKKHPEMTINFLRRHAEFSTEMQFESASETRAGLTVWTLHEAELPPPGWDDERDEYDDPENALDDPFE